jgi:hypothetical protein
MLTFLAKLSTLVEHRLPLHLHNSHLRWPNPLDSSPAIHPKQRLRLQYNNNLHHKATDSHLKHNNLNYHPSWQV